MYFPEPCFSYDKENCQRFFTKEYVDIVNCLESDICPAEYKKIYFTRSGILDKKDFGEKKIEDLFERNGYKILHPEKMSFDEQISLLKGCDSFACTEGSVSHNVIFCKDKTDVVIIRKCNMINGYQMALNSLRDFSVTYIDSNKTVPANKRHPYLGPFFLYMSDLLADYFNLPHEKFPLGKYAVYLCFVMKQRLHSIMVKLIICFISLTTFFRIVREIKS